MSDTPAPNQPPQEPDEEVNETIDPENEVDEALYETFPASDPPGYTGGEATPSQDASTTGKPEDSEKPRASDG